MLKMKKASETEKGGIDMRCAIDEIYEDGLAEGEKRGIADMLDLSKELGCSANDGEERRYVMGIRPKPNVKNENSCPNIRQLFRYVFILYSSQDSIFKIMNQRFPL